MLSLSDSDIITKILSVYGYTSLNDVQKNAVDSGLLDGQSLVISSPTSSGKTLIALIASMKVVAKGLKAIYIAPLKALAAEKYHEFKVLEKCEKNFSISVGMSHGDFSHFDISLKNKDIIIVTYEKLDSLMRYAVDWLSNVGLFVVDEIHLLGDKKRGQSLEMILTRIISIYKKSQLLGLSATISNDEEISEWLGCKIIKSTWRPTKLIEGVCENNTIYLNDGRRYEIPFKSNSKAIDLAIDVIDKGGQCLIFADTRKKASLIAHSASNVLYKKLDIKDKQIAKRLSLKIIRSGEDTELSLFLAQLISKGVAFHHAGLSNFCRSIVEESFKKRIIKLIVATPTLSSGVNLPAKRVIISNIQRYDYESQTYTPISVSEYKQLSGRAGRPQYDSSGEAIIISLIPNSVQAVFDKYILGTPEPIISQLILEKSLRTHILSIIVSIPGLKKDELYCIFSNTLFYKQTRKTIANFKVDIVINFLISENLIMLKNGRYFPTSLGTQTSFLYIDPLSTIEFQNKLNYLAKTQIDNKENYTLGLLHMITDCSDFYPKISFKKSDYANFIRIVENHSNQLFYQIDEFKCNKSMWGLYEWINESTYKKLDNELGIEPGDMHKIVESAEWLCYSLYRLVSLLDRDDLSEILYSLMIRIKHGIRDDIIPLINIEQIGRIRARILYDAGYISREKIILANEEELAKLPNFGTKLVKKIRKSITS